MKEENKAKWMEWNEAKQRQFKRINQLVELICWMPQRCFAEWTEWRGPAPKRKRNERENWKFLIGVGAAWNQWTEWWGTAPKRQRKKNKWNEMEFVFMERLCCSSFIVGYGPEAPLPQEQSIPWISQFIPFPLLCPFSLVAPAKNNRLSLFLFSLASFVLPLINERKDKLIGEWSES